jgi:hypothetical protein
MRVYLAGELSSRKRSSSVYVCPASDMRKADCPTDWLDEAGKPRNFEVEFAFGRADVASNLGEYLIRQGLAQKTSLIIPDSVKV